jgi:hypothetical protein
LVAAGLSSQIGVLATQSIVAQMQNAAREMERHLQALHRQ